VGVFVWESWLWFGVCVFVCGWVFGVVVVMFCLVCLGCVVSVVCCWDLVDWRFGRFCGMRDGLVAMEEWGLIFWIPCGI